MLNPVPHDIRQEQPTGEFILVVIPIASYLSDLLPPIYNECMAAAARPPTAGLHHVGSIRIINVRAGFSRTRGAPTLWNAIRKKLGCPAGNCESVTNWKHKESDRHLDGINSRVYYRTLHTSSSFLPSSPPSSKDASIITATTATTTTAAKQTHPIRPLHASQPACCVRRRAPFRSGWQLLPVPFAPRSRYPAVPARALPYITPRTTVRAA
ncbi:hypothetical protein BZA05DRAFT_408775 [Tricharina praecox]|uniref:uncharacterized protein n=1 Tax=Tricharina praecox TaxID=43433 RepID=UPI002220C56E|nr:uncharacterized protein BZA05DRAFT_408775 [Tricharina praecox]KAI5844874.1 hypothetical protein BZA05DRAFT_408775 [Tricharina praecox]